MPGKASLSNLLYITLGALLALVGAVVCFAVDYKSAANQFESVAYSGFQEISQHVLTAEGVVSALGSAGLMADIKVHNKDVAASGLLDSYHFISAIVRLDHVVFTEREDYIESWRDRGDLEYYIREYNPKNKRYKSVPSRNEYLVINSVATSLPENKNLIGLDILSHEPISNAVKRSLETGFTVAVPSMNYLWNRPGLLLISNTFQGDSYPESHAARVRQIAGAVFIFLDPKIVFAPVAEKYQDLDIDISLQQSSGGGKPITLYSSIASSDEKGFSLPFGFSEEHRLKLADKELVLVMSGQFQPHLLTYLAALVIMLLIGFTLRMYMVAQKRRLMADLHTQQLSQSIFHERERAEVTLRSIGDAVLTADPNSEVTYMNPVAEKMLGVAAHIAQGQQLREVVKLVDSDSEESIENPLDYFSSNSEVDDTSTRLLYQSDGEEPISVDVTCTKLSDVRGGTMGSVMVIRDVSGESALKQQLSYQASHDPLTGLFNRTKFEAEVKKAIDSFNPDSDDHELTIGHALCYMDLDQFKIVNDTCGHMAGDQLLKKLTQVLQNRVRDSDVLARLGGDEFGLLLLNCDLKNAVEIADSLRMAIKQFVFTWEGKNFDIRMSIGVVALHDSGMTHAELMSAADVACYIAKDSGRDVVHAYEPEDQMVTEHHEQMLWSQKIQDALRGDKFYLMLQTMTPLLPSQQSIQIQEFLLRILMDDGTIITPNVFIPAAERYGLMKQIDMWVLDAALKIISEVQDQNDKSTTYLYSVNLSGQSVGDNEVAEMILAKLEEYNVDAGQLMLEVTETAAVANFTVAQEFIDKLSKAGCRFALDDFGAGLSSFGYLKEMHVDFLKIDGQFVKGMSTDSIDRMMVNNITHLGYGLGLYVIAEFVEDEETMQLLREVGVHFAQGYHIQKPVSIEDWKKENMLKSIFIRTIH
jgi:diguanylate cyclase (GGDEF)-like protein/PAS domain S-box-containing protein